MSSKVSVVIPSRNEEYLQATVTDVLSKAAGDIEVIVVLDGYNPKPLLTPDPRLIQLHKEAPEGMRRGINSAVAVATGKYIMKLDAHCMLDDGYDTKLAANCEENWVSVPRRYRLDPKNWVLRGLARPPVDYQYIACAANHNFRGVEWKKRNSNKSLHSVMIDDLMTFQGSCWFMHRDYFYELELLDHDNYGPMGKEAQEISLKCWLSGGRVIRNKNTWYAHYHKNKRNYTIGKEAWPKGKMFHKLWVSNSAWDKQTKPFEWLMEKFNPPGWESQHG